MANLGTLSDQVLKIMRVRQMTQIDAAPDNVFRIEQSRIFQWHNRSKNTLALEERSTAQVLTAIIVSHTTNLAISPSCTR